MSLEGEQRPVDACHEIAGVTAEAAGLAEYIRDTNPQWEREELLNTLIQMIDDAHELGMKTHMELEDGN